METAKRGKIRRIVRLRQMLRRWRQRAGPGGPPPPDVPAGHVAVCVGSHSRRFVVRAAHLNHPVFRQLLRQAEEEFGFSSGRPGPLSLPCDESLFERILLFLSSSSSSSSSSSFQSCNLEHSDMFCSSSSSFSWLHAADSLPLLHGHRISEKPVR